MEKITSKFDIKSMIIGVFGAALIITTLGFNKPEPDDTGKFQVTSSERGIIILDTQTGDYILDSKVEYIGKMQWIKGDFKASYKEGIDKTKK